MRFTDFLKATVLISAGAATALAAIAIASASADGKTSTLVFALAWWLVAGLIGVFLGRRAQTSPPIARLLANARTSPLLPEAPPGRVLVNRLWPLLVSTICAGALAVFAPQVPAIAAGFTIIWALAWRRQESAVTAIEERDGAIFYIDRTSPFQPIRLVRTPGFVTTFPSGNGRGAPDRVLPGR